MTQTLVKPDDWPGSVVASLTALWDAMDAADLEVSKAAQDKSPASQDLEWLKEEFEAARYQLAGFLLDTLAPERDDPGQDDVASGTAEEERSKPHGVTHQRAEVI